MVMTIFRAYSVSLLMYYNISPTTCTCKSSMYNIYIHILVGYMYNNYHAYMSCIRPTCVRILTKIIFLLSGEVQIVDSPGEQGITIPVGSRLELRCESRDGANVTWYHNGIIVEDEERRNVRVLVDYQQVSWSQGSNPHTGIVGL